MSSDQSERGNVVFNSSDRALDRVVFADQASDVAALEAKCEAEREAKIKPLRDVEIAKCKADQNNDPGYCERFWKVSSAASIGGASEDYLAIKHRHVNLHIVNLERRDFE